MKFKNQLEMVDDSLLPFGGKLDKDNRWVRLAEIIPCIRESPCMQYLLSIKEYRQ